MRTTAFLFIFIATQAMGDLTVSHQVKSPGKSFGGGTLPHAIYGKVWTEAAKQCPTGFEKLREWTTVEDGKHYLHFSIKCIN